VAQESLHNEELRHVLLTRTALGR